MKTFEEILERLLSRFPEKLPAEKAWIEMSSRLSKEDFFPKTQNYKDASVLICLIPNEDDKIFIPFIQRPREKGPHSGQISLPGGKFDQNIDKEFHHTALRESEEEIGLPSDKIKILGKLTSLYIPVSNFLVHPYIGFLQKIPEFKIDKKEVEELLLFSLEEFLKPENKKYQKITIDRFLIPVQIKVPTFSIQNKIIWGATAMIMNEFLYIYKEILD